MKPLFKIVLVAYLLVLLWLVLFKFSFDLSSVLDYQRRSLNLVPFADTSEGNMGEAILNFLVFVPLGLLLSANFKQTNFWRKLTFIFLLSLAVETIQFVFAIGITDITDVITNTSGGLLGLLLYSLGNRYVPDKKLDRSIGVAGVLLLVVLFSFLYFGNVRFRHAPATGTIPLQSSQLSEASIAWQTVGQAAIGSVEEGLLACSSDSGKPRPTASMAKVITVLAIMEK